MDAERLFIERCSQINKFLDTHTEFELLDLAAVLRQLLLDEYPLVHKVNSSHRIKLRFHVGLFRQEPDSSVMIAALEDGLDPDCRPPNAPSAEVNFDKFLNHKILYLKGEAHSVRDVILFAAHVAGGVHHSDNPKEKEQLVWEFSRHLGIGGLPGGIRQLKAIARVTLKGLQPLIETIR